MKKVIAFDLDGTLAPSKSPIPARMSELMSRLLKHKIVCVISGGKFEQFQKQLLNDLRASPEELANLHIMPTCGTRYMRFDANKNEWQQIYAESIDEAGKRRIIDALNKGFDDLGMRPKEHWGDYIEDRDSQITFSTYGQDVVDVLGPKGVEMKEAWDPDDTKKRQLRDYIAPLIPDFEVRVGGVTSIDVTRPGIDKAYGIKKLMEILNLKKEDIVFIGDRLYEGGNDYPVKAFGIDSIAIKTWEETATQIEKILSEA